MFSELFLFAEKMNLLAMGEIHCTSRSYIGAFFYARTTASQRAPNWS